MGFGVTVIDTDNALNEKIMGVYLLSQRINNSLFKNPSSHATHVLHVGCFDFLN